MKKIFNKTLITATAITSLLFLALVFVSFAADGIKYNVLAPFPGDPNKIDAARSVSTFSGYLSGAIPFILRLAAVFAVVQIVIGGFQWALSEAVGNIQDAKDRMTQAIIGLVLAMTSYLILNSINPELVTLKIGIKPISQVVNIPTVDTTNVTSSAPVFHGECKPDPNAGGELRCMSVPGPGENNCSSCGGLPSGSGNVNTGNGYCVTPSGSCSYMSTSLCNTIHGTLSTVKPPNCP